MTQDEINQREWETTANWSLLTYRSSRDTRSFVPKRMGFGVTLNFGHKSAAIKFLAFLFALTVPGLVYAFLRR